MPAGARSIRDNVQSYAGEAIVLSCQSSRTRLTRPSGCRHSEGIAGLCTRGTHKEPRDRKQVA